MSLGASQLAQILQRQGVLSTEQADQVVKEARTAPGRGGNARAFEQRARAYDLVQRLQFPSTNSHLPVFLARFEIARPSPTDCESRLRAHRSAQPRCGSHRVAHLPPFRKTASNAALGHAQRSATGRLCGSLRPREHRLIQAHRRSERSI